MAESKVAGVKTNNMADSAGIVVFDDIKDCDVNVTYDLIDGQFPPPAISGLSVREDSNDLLLTSEEKKDAAGVDPGGVDNLQLGEEAMNNDADERRSEASGASSGSKIIGDVQIAEYEGSPRRYRPRPPADTSSEDSTGTGSSGRKHKTGKSGTASSAASGRVLRMPGFPQRVLPNSAAAVPPANVEPVVADTKEVILAGAATSGVSDQQHLLKFVEDASQQQNKPTRTKKNVEDYESKMRYEFSETRKVLDEFFNRDAEAAEAAAVAVEREFNELNYVLRKNNGGGGSNSGSNNGSSYAASRLATDEVSPDNPPSVTSVTSASVAASKKRSKEVDLLMGNSPSPQPPNNRSTVAPTKPNTLEVKDVMLDHRHPHVGISPLDQPHISGSGGGASFNVKEAPSAAPGVVPNDILNIEAAGKNQQPQQPPSQQDSRNFTLSPETTDCDSADLESEMSVNEGSFHSSGPKMHTAMPVLEDGLSSGHASDLEDDVIYSR